MGTPVQLLRQAEGLAAEGGASVGGDDEAGGLGCRGVAVLDLDGRWIPRSEPRHAHSAADFRARMRGCFDQRFLRIGMEEGEGGELLGDGAGEVATFTRTQDVGGHGGKVVRAGGLERAGHAQLLRFRDAPGASHSPRTRSENSVSRSRTSTLRPASAVTLPSAEPEMPPTTMMRS